MWITFGGCSAISGPRPTTSPIQTSASSFQPLDVTSTPLVLELLRRLLLSFLPRFSTSYESRKPTPLRLPRQSGPKSPKARPLSVPLLHLRLSLGAARPANDMPPSPRGPSWDFESESRADKLSLKTGPDEKLRGRHQLKHHQALTVLRSVGWASGPSVFWATTNIGQKRWPLLRKTLNPKVRAFDTSCSEG